MFVGDAEDKSLLAGKWLLRNIDHACFSRNTTPQMNLLARDAHDAVAVLDDPELTRTRLPWPSLCRDRFWDCLAARVSYQDGDSRRCQPRSQIVRATGQDDRDSGTKDDAGGISTGHKCELLCQHVASLQIRDEENVCFARHR